MRSTLVLTLILLFAAFAVAQQEPTSPSAPGQSPSQAQSPSQQQRPNLPQSDAPAPPAAAGDIIVGCLGGYMLQYWTSTMAYPLNIGGRPLHSWPSFIPVTFECTVLGAALTTVLGMLALNGLPMPYHPVFNTPRFALASRAQFFLLVESPDPKFDAEATRRFLEGLKPRGEVVNVPH